MPSRTHPPGPKGALPGLPFLSFARNPLGFLSGVAREYGDVVYFGGMSDEFYLLNHPDHITHVLVTHNASFMKGRGLQRAKRLLGEGLLTSEPPLHRRQRRLAQPAFHKQRVNAYASLMVDYALKLECERWQDGRTLDVAQEMMHLALTIVGKTLFGTETEAEAEEVRDALSASMASFARFMMPFAELLGRLPLPANRRFEQSRARLDAVIYRIIEERRASGEDRGDLLSMLLKAQDEEGDGGGMTDEQLRDEAMTIFLAGHETTANAMAWTWYLLSQDEMVETRLREELDRVMAGRTPTVEDVPKLEYTRAVIAESMRLYSPAWTMGRRAIEAHTLGGYAIEKDALVLASQWVVHRDPRWWDDAETFRPERWLTDNRRPKYAYFPFGGGNRVCIGESFAWTEAILLLATIAQQWRFTAVTTPVREPRITLRPAELQMRAIRR